MVSKVREQILYARSLGHHILITIDVLTIQESSFSCPNHYVFDETSDQISVIFDICFVDKKLLFDQLLVSFSYQNFDQYVLKYIYKLCRGPRQAARQRRKQDFLHAQARTSIAHRELNKPCEPLTLI